MDTYHPTPVTITPPFVRRRLRLLDGWPEPGATVDLGEQRASGGAQGLEPAGGPDHRVRPVSAPGAERRVQGVRVLGRGVQQPAQVRVQARGQRHGQGADEDPQSAEGRWNGRRRSTAAANGSGCRCIISLFLTCVRRARLD